MTKLLKNLLIFIFFCFVFSCSNTKNKAEINFEKLNFPKIINYKDSENTKLASEIWLSYADNIPKYIGKLVDSVIINKEEKLELDNKHFVHFSMYKNILTDSIQLGIKVDTNQIIINKKKLKSFPVAIYNKSTDTISIGSHGRIYYILEAQTQTKQWEPIQKYSIPFCGTGMVSIILAPKEMAISSILKYKGNFKTKIRIKMGQNYSNEFYGYINKSQFESEWDKNENGKTNL